MQMLIKNAKLRDREELVNILIDGGKIVDSLIIAAFFAVS